MSEQQSSHRHEPPRSRFIWLIVGTLFLLIAAVGLTLWLPHHQRLAAIEEIEERGGVLTKLPGGPSWLRAYFDNDQLSLFDQVSTIDFLQADLSDEDVELFVDLPQLSSLVVFGPELTDAGLARFQEISSLRSLLLVNCPLLTAAALNDLKAALPKLDINHRGPAFLGVGCSNSPQGCHVEGVLHGSTAHQLGIRRNDYITKFNDQPITSYGVLLSLLAEMKPGDPFRITITKHQSQDETELESTLGSWR